MLGAPEQVCLFRLPLKVTEQPAVCAWCLPVSDCLQSSDKLEVLLAASGNMVNSGLASPGRPGCRGGARDIKVINAPDARLLAPGRTVCLCSKP